MSNGKWVCTRCCRSHRIESVSVRSRYGGERCPMCRNPGSGMEWVLNSRLMSWDLSDVGA